MKVAEAKAQKVAELQAERQQLAELKRQKCGLQVADHGSFTLWEHAPGSEMHLQVKQLLESTWSKTEQYRVDMDAPIGVQEIRNPTLQDRYNQYRSTLNTPGEKLLFHGCAPQHVLTIPGEGFLKKYWKSSAGSWQRFQPGFYFALQSSKSHDYPLPEMRRLSLGQHRRQMLLCKVASGKEYITDKNMDRKPP
eukprot:COSAG02_NODE_19710_length_868_cov_1.011704_1_plen_192_part_10